MTTVYDTFAITSAARAFSPQRPRSLAVRSYLRTRDSRQLAPTGPVAHLDPALWPSLVIVVAPLLRCRTKNVTSGQIPAIMTSATRYHDKTLVSVYAVSAPTPHTVGT